MDIAAAQSAPDIGSQINWWGRKINLVLIVGVVGAKFIRKVLLFLKKVAAHLRATNQSVLRINLSQS